MYNFFKYILPILVFYNTATAQVTTWHETIKNKKGYVIINYYNSEHFISDATGEKVGIEYDLLESFFLYCEKKHQVEINRKYIKSKSFAHLYSNMKDSAISGEFAACSFSMTPKRMEEVQFSPKYMADIEVLISSHNIPLASDTAQFIELFKNTTAFTIPNTTFDDDIAKVKNIIPSLKIENAASAIEIRNRVSTEDNKLSYIELPNYLLSLKEGVNLKRQFLFKVERWGYGFIYPLNSDWKIPVEEYFSSLEFKNQINSIITKHLGNDVNELVLDLDDKSTMNSTKELSLLNKEREIQNLEIEKQNIQIENEKTFRYVLILGVLFILVVTYLIFKQNQTNIKKNKLLQTQKKIIEDKNKDITSSINYAEKIQYAALPSKNEVKSTFLNSFVYYQPKDVLSGDFYWVGETKTKTNLHFKLLAVGDCTGHGVPGALLSLMGINNLNISRKRPDINSPAEALDFLNQGIINTFSSNKESIADGMDIVMIAIEKTSLIMYYAAAINPIYIIRDNEITILKGDRHAIGKQISTEIKKFTPFDFQLKKGDKIYLFSDGYADQFGGENDKKFSYKNFRKLLLDNHTKNMKSQKEIIESTLNQWKGNTEQTDDICVFGLEV